MQQQKRDANLDLLRATAILLVVAYHVIQNSPVSQPRLMQVAVYGQYGVDVFFVLSGWLIGRLYWREHARFGDVGLFRFWARRWLRTIPPYLAALGFAWLAVFIARGQTFDWGYLLFIQNYYHNIPFFIVSWSLCVEEHFYLFVPLFLVWSGRNKANVFILFTMLILLSPICRFFVPASGAMLEFSYTHTATNLRMEGLLLGFLIAYLPDHSSAVMLYLWKFPRSLLCISLLSITLFVTLPALWQYRVGLTLLPIGIAALLVWMGSRRPGRFASSNAIHWVAVSSYSIYLTHALVIHGATRVVAKFPGSLWPVYFPVVLVLIGAVGLCFYLAFERTSIRLRDHWIPRREPPQTTPNLQTFAMPKPISFARAEISLVAKSTTDPQET